MKIKELVEMLLVEEDQDREVICQLDSEGNAFSPLIDTWVGAYKAENDLYGDAGLEELMDGYDEEDIIRDGVKAIFLVPKR